MYMDAYGSIGNWADSIIKRSITAGFSRKMAKEDLKDATKNQPQWNEKAISDDGVSPMDSKGGIGSKVNPQVVQEMNSYENQVRKKAMESLQSKIESLEGQRIYREELLAQRENDLKDLQEQNKDLENKLGKKLLRK